MSHDDDALCSRVAGTVLVASSSPAVIIAAVDAVVVVPAERQHPGPVILLRQGPPIAVITPRRRFWGLHLPMRGFSASMAMASGMWDVGCGMCNV